MRLEMIGDREGHGASTQSTQQLFESSLEKERLSTIEPQSKNVTSSASRQLYSIFSEVTDVGCCRPYVNVDTERSETQLTVSAAYKKQKG